MTIVFRRPSSTSSRLVVIDTGYGARADLEHERVAGELFHSNLARPVSPQRHRRGVIPHFHADQINGLLTTDGRSPAFPNADDPRAGEPWAFWMDDGLNRSRASKPPKSPRVPPIGVRVFDGVMTDNGHAI